jgi:hypothetical protein
MRRLGGIAVLLVALVLSACSDDGGDDAATEATDSSASTEAPDSAGSDTTGDATTTTAALELPADYHGYTSEQYADGQNWLCHPDDADENICDRDLDATLVNADGTTEVETHTKNDAPPIDCFYIYPTISNDQGLNSDLTPDDNQEVRAAVNQVARLNSTCEVYAPVYRQLTIGSLLQRVGGGEIDEDAMDAARAMAYGDVLDAWKQYIANDNHGRGVILVGHSQGAGMLTALIRDEIDDEPLLRDHIVAAYLLGTTLPVPEGEDVGGAFANLPLCRAEDQTGCVVTYASFPASSPPGDDALFGVVEDPEFEGMVAACTNPGALAGGSADLLPYFTTTESQEAAPNLPPVDTDWVGLRGYLTGECQVRNGHSIFEVTVAGDPADTRDRNLGGGLPQNWGLHLADPNLAMGNLEALAASQAAAWTG